MFDWDGSPRPISDEQVPCFSILSKVLTRRDQLKVRKPKGKKGDKGDEENECEDGEGEGDVEGEGEASKHGSRKRVKKANGKGKEPQKKAKGKGKGKGKTGKKAKESDEAGDGKTAPKRTRKSKEAHDDDAVDTVAKGDAPPKPKASTSKPTSKAKASPKSKSKASPKPKSKASRTKSSRSASSAPSPSGPAAREELDESHADAPEIAEPVKKPQKRGPRRVATPQSRAPDAPMTDESMVELKKSFKGEIIHQWKSGKTRLNGGDFPVRSFDHTTLSCYFTRSRPSIVLRAKKKQYPMRTNLEYFNFSFNIKDVCNVGLAMKCAVEAASCLTISLIDL